MGTVTKLILKYPIRIRTGTDIVMDRIWVLFNYPTHNRIRPDTRINTQYNANTIIYNLLI